MILYHGSNIIVDKPRILQSQRLLDFGMGFYTTTNKEQAIRWALRVATRRNAVTKYVTVYEFDYERAKKELKIIHFMQADEAWLNFVCTNRSGKRIYEEYDIVIGPVADDYVYMTVQLFETGVLDKGETIKRLKVEKLYDQVLFHTKKALSLCKYKEFILL
jgi:hypothetical protein